MRSPMAWMWAFVLAACSTALEPASPVWNRQSCDECRMALSDDRHAAQIVGADGRRRWFDDIGCLVLHLRDEPAPKAIWVTDEASGAWLPAVEARFRFGASTPMGYGVAAGRGGDGMTFDALDAALRERQGAPR